MDDKYYYMFLNMLNGLGPVRIAKLYEQFKSYKEAWDSIGRSLLVGLGFREGFIGKIVEQKEKIQPEKVLEELYKKGIKMVFREDEEYPEILNSIYDPPFMLYAQGNLKILESTMIAIVGARRASHYGLAVAESIAQDLAESGVCVVSGMARGIDTAAHKGALKVQGKTVAVLGCGIDVVYPRENKRLMEEIIDSGVVLSEFAPGTSPQPGNFPQRNRIISGLSQGILIVEAALKSGSLITADFALEQGRDVYAVPGQVTNDLNRGAHKLIQQGALLVESAVDILQEIGWEREKKTKDSKPSKQENLTTEEVCIYNIISDEPVNTDYIVKKSGYEPSVVLSFLLMLEIKGLICEVLGQGYIRAM